MRRKNWKGWEYRYLETWTVKKILDWGIDFFKKKDIPQARLSAELLLASVLRLTRMELYLNHSRTLGPEELATYKNYIVKRLEHVPIQYILGEAHFRNISLFVDQNVLIPRPETELLVEKALEEAIRLVNKKQSINILEVGTGSGAVILSLYSEILERLPGSEKKIRITATDISSKAIIIARKNAEKVLSGDLIKNLSFIQCDTFPADDAQWLSENKGKIDLIISNPPYITQSGYEDLPREIREYEPRDALVAGETGLESYEKILSKIKDIVNTGSACIIFETDPTVGESLSSMVKKFMKIKGITLDKDYNQRDRILTLYI
jgi:release factor glutamine methyltransferase